MENSQKNYKDRNEIIAGNLYNKYNSKNPIARFLMYNFLNSLNDLLNLCKNPGTILEVGCGEGHLINFIKNKKNVCDIEALDLSEEILNIGRSLYPDINFIFGSVYQLPYNDNSKDLLIACELLEHLDKPIAALKEINRVAKKNIILSVPREPYWSLCNICRMKYLQYLGNTPPHLQKWTKKQFQTLISKYFKIIKIRTPFPWVMILCTLKNRI